jgi:DNA-binding phage protein
MENQVAQLVKILADISAAVAALNEIINNQDEAFINRFAFEDSWSMAQVMEHINLSTASIIKALKMQAAPANRHIAERKNDLESTFMNFGVKLHAPAFIVPDCTWYEKPALLHHFNYQFKILRELAVETDLSGLIKHDIFGDITKLELLYFVSFHTQRHLHQVKNIMDIG